MGKKPGGAGAGAGWLETVRKVFKPSNKDPRHAKKHRGGEPDGGGGGEAAEIVSVDNHFPAAYETSPEVTNERGGAAAWRGRVEDDGEVVHARWRRRGPVAVTAASKVARIAAAHGRAGGREERAAVRIQAFYRGYLARRARRALRGLVRLQALVRGHQVRRQVHLTMRCMQALVRAQARVRARRLTPDPLAAAPHHHHQQQQHGGRRSFGHDRVVVACPPEQSENGHGNVMTNPFLQQGAAVRADGMFGRLDAAAGPRERAAPAYTYGCHHHHHHHRQQLGCEEEQDGGGWNWLDTCGGAGGVVPQPQQASKHGAAAETSYVTAAATDGGVSEQSVEMEEEEGPIRSRSPTRDDGLHPPARQPPAIPGYMAATQSARAKARAAPPPQAAAAPRPPHARSRSGSGSAAAPCSGGSTSTASFGWSTSHSGGGGSGARVPQKRAGPHSPEESSCSGDRTPPALGARSRMAFA